MTASITVDAIRDCLEGVIPATVATCAPDGTPNVSYVSQIHYVDSGHVALTFQFFNKTRENVLAHPRAAVLAVHPLTAARYRLELDYLRTEMAGPLFESMKAKLAGIASHTGMVGVFRLRGADVYRVRSIAQLPGRVLPAATPRRNLLASLRACAQVFARNADLSVLLEDLLEALARHMAITHAMVLMLDAPGQRLYTVASRSYPQSGVGSEVLLGCVAVSVRACHSAPACVTHMPAE
jgi:adenylate cyclase